MLSCQLFFLSLIVILDANTRRPWYLSGGLFAHEEHNSQNDKHHDHNADDRCQHDKRQLEWLLILIASQANLATLQVKYAIVMTHEAVSEDPKVCRAQAHHGQLATIVILSVMLHD